MAARQKRAAFVTQLTLQNVKSFQGYTRSTLPTTTVSQLVGR